MNRADGEMVSSDGLSLVCCFDADFPIVNTSAPNGDRPYLLFYKGDLSLLGDLNRIADTKLSTDLWNAIDCKPYLQRQLFSLLAMKVVMGIAVLAIQDFCSLFQCGPEDLCFYDDNPDIIQRLLDYGVFVMAA